MPPDPTQDLSDSSTDMAGGTGSVDLSGGGGGNNDLATPDLSSPPPPDLSNPPPDLAKITNCSIIPQSGCLTGDKCTTHDAMTTICDPSGPDSRGQICTTTNSVDTCNKSLACIDEGKSKSQCRQFCNSDADCGARSYCQFKLDNAGTFKVCSQPCNAIYPGAGCAAGLGCYVASTERTDCKAPGTAGDNAPCNTATDCKPGMVCYGPAGSSVCHRVCKKGDPTQCLGTDDCYNITSWTSYGICCHWLNGC